MATVDKKTKKRNFEECEVDVLLSEVAARRNVIFGGLSTGITNKKKRVEWQEITAAVNSVSSTGRTVPEIKKKWFDLKVEGKKRLAAHRASLAATGGGKPTSALSDFDLRMASIIEDAPLCGVVKEQSEDSEMEHETAVKEPVIVVELGAVAAEDSSAPSSSGVSRQTATPSPRVPTAPSTTLTDAGLQIQRDTISAIQEVARELREIKAVLSDISVSLNDLL